MASKSAGSDSDEYEFMASTGVLLTGSLPGHLRVAHLYQATPFATPSSQEEKKKVQRAVVAQSNEIKLEVHLESHKYSNSKLYLPFIELLACSFSVLSLFRSCKYNYTSCC